MSVSGERPRRRMAYHGRQQDMILQHCSNMLVTMARLRPLAQQLLPTQHPPIPRRTTMTSGNMLLIMEKPRPGHIIRLGHLPKERLRLQVLSFLQQWRVQQPPRRQLRRQRRSLLRRRRQLRAPRMERPPRQRRHLPQMLGRHTRSRYVNDNDQLFRLMMRE